MRGRIFRSLAMAVLAGCGAANGAGSDGAARGMSPTPVPAAPMYTPEPAPQAKLAAGCIPGAPPVVVSPPKALLTIDEARRYMVALVNRDRRTECLPPVELDEGAPTRAGQAHAEDMATNGYLGHWGTDGSTPEQRHTEAGGSDMVLENASCFV